MTRFDTDDIQGLILSWDKALGDQLEFNLSMASGMMSPSNKVERQDLEAYKMIFQAISVFMSPQARSALVKTMLETASKMP